MLLTESDLYTHIYQDIVDEIKRNDNTVIGSCLRMAEEEAKSFLGRYDLDKLFGIGNAAPEVSSILLKSKVKDIACWQLIKLANPNISYEAFRLAYEDTISYFKMILNGKVTPDGWPLKPDAGDYKPGASITWKSNPKRRNHY
jgi:phage gp36-like protein